MVFRPLHLEKIIYFVLSILYTFYFACSIVRSPQLLSACHSLFGLTGVYHPHTEAQKASNNVHFGLKHLVEGQ